MATVQPISSHLETEAKVINKLRELREKKATGKIEVNIIDGGVCAVYATITEKVK